MNYGPKPWSLQWEKNAKKNNCMKTSFLMYVKINFLKWKLLRLLAIKLSQGQDHYNNKQASK